jgi:hypothetical protein
MLCQHRTTRSARKSGAGAKIAAAKVVVEAVTVLCVSWGQRCGSAVLHYDAEQLALAGSGNNGMCLDGIEHHKALMGRQGSRLATLARQNAV